MSAWARPALRVAATLPALTGLIVLLGWFTHQVTLIRIHPTFVGMRFNTALCFVLAGTALWLGDLGRPRATRLLGLFLTLFCALTFSQDFTGVALGLDQLFMADYLTMGTTAPGRMAPSTSTCFVILGLVFLLEGPERRPWVSWAQSLGAAALVAMGGLSLFGYLSGVTTFMQWGKFAYMAMHTALGMFVLGLGVLLHAWRQWRGEGIPAWLPVPFALAALFATLLVWRALRNQERHVMEGILVQEAMTLSHQLKGDFEERHKGLLRMASRWEHAVEAPKRSEWETDAALYVAHQPGYRALEWVDRDYHIQWVVPRKGNERVVGVNLSGDAIRRAPYERAAQEGTAVSGEDIDLLQGGRGFVHCIPVRRGGRPDGFVTAVFEIQAWMDAVWGGPKPVTIEVRSRDRVLFTSGSVEAADVDQGVSVDLPFEGRIWQMRVHPTPTLRSQVRTKVPSVVLITGATFTLLVALLVRSLHGAMATAGQLETAARERQKAEQALREADISRSLILENATVGIGLVVDRRFTWVNQRLAQMMGMPYEAVQGAPTRVIYPDEESWNLVGREAYPVLARGEVYDVELQLRRVGGEPFWCRFVGRAMDPSRANEGSIWMFEDIDARVRSERMQRQFVSTVSHELRTPLTAIKGSMALLQAGLGGRLDSEGEGLLDIALANCDRLVRLVNEILDMEKLRAGGLEFLIREEDLVKVLRESAEANGGLALQAGVILGVGAMPDRALARVDAYRLRQVLDNLLSNAVKFSPQGGRVELGLAPRTGGWTLTVRDEGRGIPESFLPRLFEPFTQADGSDARERGGTGLGLSITKALVEGMAGSIRVESAPGKGSTFYIDLPDTESPVTT